MTTKYTFIAETEEGTVACVFTSHNETWSEPLEEFFKFLKGCGFLFDTVEELAVFNTSTGESRNGHF